MAHRKKRRGGGGKKKAHASRRRKTKVHRRRHKRGVGLRFADMIGRIADRMSKGWRIGARGQWLKPRKRRAKKARRR